MITLSSLSRSLSLKSPEKELSGWSPQTRNNWIIALTHSCAHTLHLILCRFYMFCDALSLAFVIVLLEQFSKQCFMSYEGIKNTKMFMQHNSLFTLPTTLFMLYFMYPLVFCVVWRWHMHVCAHISVAHTSF